MQLSGAGSTDEDHDVLSFSWGVPVAIDVADKTAQVIEFVTPVVTVATDFQFTLFVRDVHNGAVHSAALCTDGRTCGKQR